MECQLWNAIQIQARVGENGQKWDYDCIHTLREKKKKKKETSVKASIFLGACG